MSTHTASGSTADTAANAAGTHHRSPFEADVTGHAMICPAEIDEIIMSTVSAALDHVAPVNRHARNLTSMAKVPEIAHTIYLLLTQFNADVLADEGRIDDPECPGCQVDSLVKHGLLEPGDEVALMSAQARACRNVFRFAAPTTGTSSRCCTTSRRPSFAPPTPSPAISTDDRNPPLLSTTSSARTVSGCPRRGVHGRYRVDRRSRRRIKPKALPTHPATPPHMAQGARGRPVPGKRTTCACGR